MQTEGHTVKNIINRYQSFRYVLILEGIAVGAISGAFVVLFRYLLTYAEKLLNMVCFFDSCSFCCCNADEMGTLYIRKWDSPGRR